MHNYHTYFSKLLKVVEDQEMDPALGEAIKKHATQFGQVWSETDFSRCEDRYVRTYIGKDATSGWEAIVMTWKRGNRTQIHGHPAFASYTGLTGQLLVEAFEPIAAGKCKKVAEYIVEQGQSLYSIGVLGRFDNHIHRMSCLSEKAHSLHIYSNDALLGQVYESE